MVQNDDDDENERSTETHNRMTAAGGNLLYHAMIAKKASIASYFSETSWTEGSLGFRGSSTSVASQVSKKISDPFKRMSKRISMAFGYNRRSSESMPHGLYSNINLMPKEPPIQKASEASGSLSLKLTYTFMFVEWLIFCSMMPYIFTLIGKLFESVFN